MRKNTPVYSRHDMRDYAHLHEHIASDERLSTAFKDFRRDSERQGRWDRRHMHIPLDEADPLQDIAAPIEISEQVTNGMLLRLALNSLTDISRRRLLLYYTQGYSHCEIARMEGVSREAVTKSINTALRTLRERLKYI